MMQDTVYTREQMRELRIMTQDYAINVEEGSFSARLDLKAEGHSGTLRLFFTFDDGRKIISPVYWWNRYLGFYELPVGSRVLLTYTRSSQGVFLTGAELI